MKGDKKKTVDYFKNSDCFKIEKITIDKIKPTYDLNTKPKLIKNRTLTLPNGRKIVLGKDKIK